ncbi:MAG: DHH family phosphoesterase [Parcubacteria group bacterium]
MAEQELFKKINSAHNILLISHRRPDADTLGSATALAFLIRDHFKKAVRVFCVDSIPENCKFLGVEQFLMKKTECDFNNFDLIIAVDCGDEKQTGVPELFASLAISNIRMKEYSHQSVNVDHHQTNSGYADLNIIDANASSTSEIIYKLLKENNLPITKEISTALLAGIVSDTNNFTNAATAGKTMTAAGDLLQRQARFKQVSTSLNRQLDIKTIKLWGRTLSELHYNEEYGVLGAIVPRSSDLDPAVASGLSDFLMAQYRANIVAVIVEEPGNQLKVSLRTTADDIDVSVAAKHFGGGGHKKAAGFSMDGRLQWAEEGWEIV